MFSRLVIFVANSSSRLCKAPLVKFPTQYRDLPSPAVTAARQRPPFLRTHPSEPEGWTESLRWAFLSWTPGFSLYSLVSGKHNLY